MNKLTMYRREFSFASTGVLLLPNHNLYTIERPFIEAEGCRAGKPFESCIPYGTYGLERYSSDKYKNVFVLFNHDLGVYQTAEMRKHDTDRYACLIHIANWAKDVVGCIGVGTGASYNPSTGGHMVMSSKDAMGILRSEIGPFDKLEIKPYEFAAINNR